MQVVHDVAIQKLPVRFAIDRAGLVGADGQTHAGAFDVTYLSCLPGMVVMAGDEAELVHMVSTAVAYDEGRWRSAIPAAKGSVWRCRKRARCRRSARVVCCKAAGVAVIRGPHGDAEGGGRIAAHGYPATAADGCLRSRWTRTWWNVW